MLRSFPRISVGRGVKLGMSEVALGNIQAAQQHYQSAIEGLDAAIGRGTGGESLAGIAPRDVFTALVYDARAVAKLRFGESHALTGNVQQAEQHYREAIVDCDQVLALEFQKVEAFYTRGRAKAALADDTGAISDFERAVTIKPDHALAYYAQGARETGIRATRCRRIRLCQSTRAQPGCR